MTIIQPKYRRTEALAIKALYDGDASAAQQKIALNAIIEKIAATHDLGWFADSERASSFASGRRFVGLEIVYVIKQSLDRLPILEEPND